MIDRRGRVITYLRLSVTDRCNLRCGYCMTEDPEFLPKTEILSLEELDRLACAFIRLGVRRLRLTGGEPLVRRGVMTLVDGLSRWLATGELEELTLTTNGTRLAELAEPLKRAGVERINVSLDTLDAALFRRITRVGHLETVLEGLDRAARAGLRVKINTVALKGVNEDQYDGLIAWCGTMGFDLSLIETMPMGGTAQSRAEGFLPLDVVRQRLEERWTLTPTDVHTSGPARYVRIAETGRLLGFIAPMTHSFCQGCNRVRVTCTGRLYPCLGQETYTDLRPALRQAESDEPLERAILAGIDRKPRGHDFVIDDDPCHSPLERHMNMTGG